MSIGHSPTKAPHTPDMRKNQEDVTEAEQAEAKRRIEGSLNAGAGSHLGFGAMMK